MSPAAQPYAQDEVIVGEAVALHLRPASFLLRGAGVLLDIFVCVTLLIITLLSVNPLLLDPSLQRAVSIFLLVFFLVIVPCTVEVLSGGRSLGKWAVGVRIVRNDGGAIGFRHSAIRALLGVFEFYLTFGGVAVAVALLNPQSKRLGDLLAGTYAQHTRVPMPVLRRPALPPELTQWAGIADVAALPPGVSRRLSQFFDSAPRMLPHAAHRLACELAAEVSSYVSPIPQAAPDRFLAAVVAIRYEREERALIAERSRLARVEPILQGLSSHQR